LLGEAHVWGEDAVSAAAELLQKKMAFVPAGSVRLKNIAIVDASDEECGEFELEEEAFFIDRYAVTNSRFQRFVDADAYRDESFWPAEVQPSVFQFVDSSGAPGPAPWKDGTYDPAKRDHPVVGISWHEANAFANWTGKTLPTASQWQRAGTWWNADVRYTWGSSYEQGRANIFATGIGDTVSVSDYSDSATPNGIVQLVGNVWEWVDGCFAEVEFEGRMIEIEEPLGEIRGGAYDSYFPTQANCIFRSGQALMSRTHNVGFRCAASAHLLAEMEAEI
jgi:iron(II)-dependent oxidoreductase